MKVQKGNPFVNIVMALATFIWTIAVLVWAGTNIYLAIWVIFSESWEKFPKIYFLVIITIWGNCGVSIYEIVKNKKTIKKFLKEFI